MLVFGTFSISELQMKDQGLVTHTEGQFPFSSISERKTQKTGGETRGFVTFYLGSQDAGTCQTLMSQDLPGNQYSLTIQEASIIIAHILWGEECEITLREVE